MFPRANQQRSWFHKTANVLVALPKSARLSHLVALVRTGTRFGPAVLVERDGTAA